MRVIFVVICRIINVLNSMKTENLGRAISLELMGRETISLELMGVDFPRITRGRFP